MEKLKSGVEFIFSSYKRTAIVFVIGALALSIPITISLLNQQQDIRQRASQVCENVAADIMLVVDKSQSMNDRSSGSSQTLLQKAKSAAKQFIDNVSTNNQNKVGLVSYSSQNDTSLNSPLTSNFSSVKTKVDSINATGFTCTECGIKKANDEITAHKRSGFKNAIILLTDGRANVRLGSNENNEQRAEAAALAAAKAGNQANGTVYFTIGLGSQVNESFLQEIANETGGQYFFAPNADQLQGIYNQISQIVGKGAISGFVYSDNNGNGVQDATEAKLSGWQLNLKASGQTNATQTTTDDSGGFSIAGICDGEYNLSITPQTGWTVTSPTSGNYNVIIVNGQAQSDKSFGVREGLPSPTATLTPIVTSTPSATAIHLSLELTGIGGESSDAARLGINTAPETPTRDTEIEIYNSQNQLVSSSSGSVVFDSTTGLYEGTVSLGNNFQTGPYTVKARINNTLWRAIPGIQLITSGSTYDAPSVELVSGDVIHDNVVNLLDYNAFLSCMRDRDFCTDEVQDVEALTQDSSPSATIVPSVSSSPSATISLSPTQISSISATLEASPSVSPTILPPVTGIAKIFDFNDDGLIEEKDLNILLRSFARRFGD